LVSELIYKKSKAKLNGKIITVDSNKLVEDSFSELGLLCLEDLVNEVYEKGENFMEVA
jgi:hypothetical protein